MIPYVAFEDGAAGGTSGFIRRQSDRDDYGALLRVPPDVRRIIRRAIASAWLPEPYNTIRRHRTGHSGLALDVKVYDYRGSVVLVQLLTREGSKYGVSATKKEYKLLRAVGRGGYIADANKYRVARLANKASCTGEVIDQLIGTQPLDVAIPAPEGIIARVAGPRIVFKVMRQLDSGQLLSCHDGRSYALGKRRTNTAMIGRRGGLYHYSTPDACLEAARDDYNIDRLRFAGHRLVVIACEATGRQVDYPDPTSAGLDGGRNLESASTHLRPLYIVRKCERVSPHQAALIVPEGEHEVAEPAAA